MENRKQACFKFTDQNKFHNTKAHRPSLTTWSALVPAAVLFMRSPALVPAVKVNMSQSFWDEAQKPPIKKTTRAELESCTGRFGAVLCSYLFLLLQIVQGHGGKDGLDFNLEPTDGEGRHILTTAGWDERCACALPCSALSL